MHKQAAFSFVDRLKSFKFAWSGLKLLWQYEHNFRIHISFFALACLFGFVFSISTSEWLFVILSSGLVLLSEALNSSIEKLADHVTPELNSSIKKVKDLAAAAVLISAFTALAVGLIIYIPKILILRQLYQP